MFYVKEGPVMAILPIRALSRRELLELQCLYRVVAAENTQGEAVALGVATDIERHSNSDSFQGWDFPQPSFHHSKQQTLILDLPYRIEDLRWAEPISQTL